MPDAHGVIDAPPADRPIVILAGDALEPVTRRISWVGVLLLLAIVYGTLGRISAARYLTPHIDEPASVLAAQMVAEKGVPIFPSGVPYFQGAVLSYLLAPFTWFGHGEIADLHLMRYVSVLIGVLTIVATFLLARQVSGQGWVGAIAAILVASDPVSVKWSGLVRMYAPLELFAVLFIWMTAVVLMDGPTRRRLALAALFFWLGVFTHIATALLWPAAALAALAVHGRKLWGERRDIGFTLGVSAAAPVALTLASTLLARGGANASAGGELPGVSFVGDHLLTLDAITQPSFAAWEALFGTSALLRTMPYVAVFVSALLIGVFFFHRGDGAPARRARIGVGLALAAYWLPIIVVGVFTREPQERYVIHIVPSGFVLIALGLQELMRRATEPRTGDAPDWHRRCYAGGALALALLLVLNQISGALGLQRRQVLDPDYVAVSEWVEARRNPGEPVFSAMTPAPYLALGADVQLNFISGNPYSQRTRRYTRLNSEGEFVDYWIGVPSYFLMNDLCSMILDNPKAWIIIDDTRLLNSGFVGGDYARMIQGLTYQAYRHSSGAIVLRPSPPPGRHTYAERMCAKAATLAEQGIDELTWQRPPLFFR